MTFPLLSSPARAPWLPMSAKSGVTPVDSRVEALGGVVFRSLRTTVEDDQQARDVVELKEEIAQLKAEHAQARADRKAKLQARIDGLSAKLQTKLDEAKQRSEQIKAETDAKVQALHKERQRPKVTRRQPLMPASLRYGQITKSVRDA